MSEEVKVAERQPVRQDEFLRIELRGMEPVPAAERHGSPHGLALVWTGSVSNYISLLTGALVISAPLAVGAHQGQLGLLDSALAIMLGAACAAILHGLLNATGARTGTPQMIFARGVYGHRGVYPAALLTWLMALGWFAVDCIIGGWALVQLLGIFGVPKTTEVALGAITLVLIASVVVAIYGHQTVHVFEKYGALVFMIFCALLFVFLFPKVHWQFPTTVHGSSRFAAIAVGGSFIYALVASWIPFASDYSRYLPLTVSARHTAWWTGLGIGLPVALLGILGMVLSTINPANGDLLSVITTASPPWLTVPFLLFVVLGEIWANYFDVYTAGLVALAMDIPLRRWTSALVCGLLGGIFVYGIGFFSHFNRARTYTELNNAFLSFYTDFLLLTYLWVPSWAAVLLIDFFVFRHGSYTVHDLTRGRAGSYWYRGGVFWRAVIAWMIGLVVTLPFIGSATLPWLATPWQGPLARVLGGVDVSGIIGALVSAGVYLLLGWKYFRHSKSARDYTGADVVHDEIHR
ncbi:purine-cytosine permease family protein [Dictyobacter arantiisoli]|uniref:Cytosine permease n=1 Tax=Dictyobacter arantiisoli TaxID=2014874 RepID=A0A5A5TKW4_9CHLR|nr:cytosine permease [Dictyobacter arantiisoli]GCF11574.1 cytosine permease [Dictyobacter arantiisoli]